LYEQRNLIERGFNRLKQFRRFGIRYCRTIEVFRSRTALACAWLPLQLPTSDVLSCCDSAHVLRRTVIFDILCL
jgi:hypothetical protein